MKEHEVFKDEKLSLSSLSNRLGITDKKLSRFINEGLQTNFNDYVNAFRVEDMKAKLRTSALEKYTMMALASDSGFTSKASFYRIFKKHVGQTPKEYQIANK